MRFPYDFPRCAMMTFTLEDATPTGATKTGTCRCGAEFEQRQYDLGAISASVWGLPVLWLPLACDDCERDAGEGKYSRPATWTGDAPPLSGEGPPRPEPGEGAGVVATQGGEGRKLATPLMRRKLTQGRVTRYVTAVAWGSWRTPYE